VRLVDFGVTLKMSRYLPSINLVCDSRAGMDEKNIFVIGSIIGVRIQSQTMVFTGFFPSLGGTKRVVIDKVIIIPIQAIISSLEYTIGKKKAITVLQR